MPQSLPSPSVSFKHLVATQFASRPGLREVVASAGFDALAARYPWTRKNHPQLQSLTGFSILHDLDEGPLTPPGNLVDTLLEHFLSGQPMALKPTEPEPTRHLSSPACCASHRYPHGRPEH